MFFRRPYLELRSNKTQRLMRLSNQRTQHWVCIRCGIKSWEKVKGYFIKCLRLTNFCLTFLSNLVAANIPQDSRLNLTPTSQGQMSDLGRLFLVQSGNQTQLIQHNPLGKLKISFIFFCSFAISDFIHEKPSLFFSFFSGFRSTNNATPKEEIQPQQSESENIISSASQSAGLFEHEATTSGQQDVTSQYVRKPDVYDKGQQQQSVTQEPKENRDNSRPSQTTGNIEMIEQLKYVR